MLLPQMSGEGGCHNCTAKAFTLLCILMQCTFAIKRVNWGHISSTNRTMELGQLKTHTRPKCCPYMYMHCIALSADALCVMGVKRESSMGVVSKLPLFFRLIYFEKQKILQLRDVTDSFIRVWCTESCNIIAFIRNSNMCTVHTLGRLYEF